jgi:hypothetical protein
MLPFVLSGPRRWLFARLLANGLFQSGVAICLAVTINYVLSVQKPNGEQLFAGAFLLSALAIMLVALRSI